MPEMSQHLCMCPQTPYGLLNFMWGSILPTHPLNLRENLLPLFHLKIGYLPQEAGRARRGCGRLVALEKLVQGCGASILRSAGA